MSQRPFYSSGAILFMSLSRRRIMIDCGARILPGNNKNKKAKKS